MARDRQRAKHRRNKKRPGAGDPQAKKADGNTPVPDPLTHSSSSVDEAKFAETGAQLPGDNGLEYADDVERAPDEIEGDLLPSSVAKRSGLSADAADRESHREPSRFRLFTFLGHVVDELRRVQWPTRKQVFQGTAVTLGFVLLAGGYLGLLDALWKPLIEAIL